MIDSLMFGIPVDENVSVMKLSTGSLESYLSKRIFPTEILTFKGTVQLPTFQSLPEWIVGTLVIMVSWLTITLSCFVSF